MMTVYEKLVRKHGYSEAQKKIISLISNGEVLEIGSSSGYMTRQFIKAGSVVDVVEIDRSAASDLKGLARSIFIGSIEDKNIQRKINQRYDFIVCADVLEHLINPRDALIFLKRKLKKSGRVFISIPNVAFWNMRVDLLFGRFDYQESGLLDKTHLRFYTYIGFLKLLKECDYKIEDICPAETKIPFELTLLKLPVLGKIIVSLLKVQLLRYFPNLVIFHYVVQAKNKN